MAYSVDIFNEEGKKVKTVDLNSQIFNDENVNEGLIHEFVLMQLANARNPIAHTKTRGEVTNSNKKLFRQKGTGRARVGDAGSPIRKKGGVAFGPRNEENYTKSMPKKMRRKALFGALTLKARDSEIICLNKYSAKGIKTKDAFNVLKNLGLENDKVLLVIPSSDEQLIKSFRNIEDIKYLIVDYINPYDLLTFKKVLFLEDSLSRLESVFLK